MAQKQCMVASWWPFLFFGQNAKIVFGTQQRLPSQNVYFCPVPLPKRTARTNLLNFNHVLPEGHLQGTSDKALATGILVRSDIYLLYDVT